MVVPIKEILSNGYEIGKIKPISYTVKKSNKKAYDFEIKRLDNSINLSLKEIEILKEKEPKMSDYLMAFELMINDKVLYKRITEFLKSGLVLEDAINSAFNEIVAQMMTTSSGYLRERIDDIKDVENMLISNLDLNEVSSPDEKHIIYADRLSPSYLIRNRQSILGAIIKNGGYTSHSAIMCRLWEIPLVVSEIELTSEDIVIIDTRKKILNVNPSSFEIENFIMEKKKYNEYHKSAIPHDDFKFLANVATIEDVKKAMDYGFDGIGLFRTEFIFMNSNRAYTMLEQYNIYLEACNLCKDKTITFRSFDIGDDKKISYMITHKKGIDNYKNNPDIFEAQIKAILASNIHNNVKIMFPMIETIEEFNYLKDWVIRIQKENNYNLPKIGMMLETKKALMNIEEFKDVEFFSVGTNDLTQELYNIKRSENYDIAKFITDLLNQLKKVVKFTTENNIELSVCGELATIPAIAANFYRIGIKNLSVSPGYITCLNDSYTSFIRGNKNE